MDMDKWCLRWDQFDTNIRDYFRTLSENQRFFDVTLATDDGQQIQAHKIILSAGSNFFSDIFLKSNHSNMLIYLKGISSAQLEPIIDFMYKGEAFITQDELKQFLETGKELQVKGIQGELQGLQNHDIDQESVQDEHVAESTNDFNVAKKGNHLLDSSHSFDQELSRVNGNSLESADELDIQIRQIVEERDGVWACKVCGKTATRKGSIKRHAETHIEGISHTCHICSKTYKNKSTRDDHISQIHSMLFSCNICDKTGMNRHAYSMHKQRNHKKITDK